jgi:hypothetical protein
MTAEEFAVDVLSKMKAAASKGLETIARRTSRSVDGDPVLPDVAVLARAATEKSEFLLGQEPIWADLHSGRAILRESDENVWRSVQGA